ncbi:MAG: hypothetical protein QF394_13610, partial [Rhodospirillales bacterium]|nr:hypothetical protein [Rhodospirillales bacterium]
PHGIRKGTATIARKGGATTGKLRAFLGGRVTKWLIIIRKKRIMERWPSPLWDLWITRKQLKSD